MNVTKHGVYLVTDEDEYFLGRTTDILQSPPGGPFGQGISLHALIMDIVQGIVSDPLRNSKTVTIEIRE